MLGNLPIAEFVLDNLPWLYGRTSGIACVRCGETDGVELHHRAPRPRFGVRTCGVTVGIDDRRTMRAIR
jgi:hypothetical protein